MAEVTKSLARELLYALKRKDAQTFYELFKQYELNAAQLWVFLMSFHKGLKPEILAERLSKLTTDTTNSSVIRKIMKRK